MAVASAMNIRTAATTFKVERLETGRNAHRIFSEANLSEVICMLQLSCRHIVPATEGVFSETGPVTRVSLVVGRFREALASRKFPA